MSHLVYLGLGSNLGDKSQNILNAIRQLDMLAGEVLRTSSFYVSEPWGYHSANHYFNAVCELLTDLSPLQLLDQCKDIERIAGRKPTSSPHDEDRPLDIDILLFDDRVISSPRLQIPHPRLHLRAFVLLPLAELIPDFVVPLSGLSVTQMRDALPRLDDTHPLHDPITPL